MRQALGQPLIDEGAVVVLGEGAVERFDERQARLERGLGAAGAARPGLVLREEGRDLLERVGRGRVEDGRDRSGVGGRGEELIDAEEIGLVRLARRPEARVGEEPREEVDDRVAERVADAGRVVAGLPEVREFPGPAVGQAVAVLPDADESGPRLGEELIARPGLEVDGAGGLDALALVDLPRIGAVVGDERARVEKLQHVAVDRGGRPRPRP